MNDDLIKRSDAIEAIEVVDWYHQNCNKDMVHGANSNIHQAWYKSQDVYEALENVPSTDRPQGEWIVHGEAPIYVKECSACGAKFFHHATEDLTPFCAMCGAKMKGVDDDR